MSVGFGFSVGDFIAGIQLVREVISSLQSGAGSALEYRTLTNELFTLERALLEVKALRLEDCEAAQLDALKCAATLCQATIDLFLAKIRKYQPSLNAQGSGSKVRDSIRKIQWALCKKPDLEAFKAEVRGYAGSINILLATIQLNQVGVYQQSTERRQESVLSTLNKNFLAQMHAFEKFGTAITTCAKQGQQLLQATAAIVQSNIHIYQMVLQVHRFIVALPPQVERKQPIYFIDAFGKEAPFFLEWVYSHEVLQDWLERRFEAVGRDKIIRKEFAIEDIKTKRQIDLSKPWHTLFYPGMHVGMDMVFTDMNSIYKNTCPSCQAKTSGSSDEGIICSNCGTNVRRVTILDGATSCEVHTSSVDSDNEVSDELFQQERTRQKELCQYRRLRLLSSKQLPLFKYKRGRRNGPLVRVELEKAKAMRKIGSCPACFMSHKEACSNTPSRLDVGF